MTVRKTTALASGAALALSGLISVSPPAQAETIPAKHCVGSLSTGRTECFSTFTAAIRKATDGRVTDAPAAVPDAAGRASLSRSIQHHATKQAAGEVIQGTFFDNRDFGGDTFTVTGAGLCDGSDGVINYQFDFPSDWFDRISSVQPWASCKIWLYPDVGLNGDRDGPFTQNTGWVGTMLDDRTRSVGFS